MQDTDGIFLSDWEGKSGLCDLLTTVLVVRLVEYLEPSWILIPATLRNGNSSWTRQRPISSDCSASMPRVCTSQHSSLPTP